MSQATIAGGRRMSTAALLSGSDPQPPEPAYRDRCPARRRCCWTARAASASATRSAARCSEARVGREVVVSAGAINSPQLLELSGIGQPERLRELGIEVRHALPGVGENLRDHYAPRTRWLIGRKGITFNDRGRGLGLVGQALRYALRQPGPARHGGRAAARLRPLPRGAGGAGPAARLGADADRTGPEAVRVSRGNPA